MQISVVIPAYNVAPYIVKTLDSLRQHKKISYEIIVVNDGSTDSTGEVITTYIEQSDQNIRYVEQENSGVSAARNTGIKFAVGEFILFLDGDDFVEPNYLYDMYTVAISDRSEIVTSLFYHTWVDGTSVSRNYEKYQKLPNYFSNHDFLNIFFLNTTILNTGSLIFKRELIEQWKIRFDTSMTHCEDHKFFITAFLKANRISLVKDRYYHYLQRPQSLTTAINPVTIRARVNLYAYWLKCDKIEHLFQPKTREIIRKYNLPEAIENIFSIYCTEPDSRFFTRYYNKRYLRKYLLLGVFFYKTTFRKRIKYLLLLLLPTVYISHCRSVQNAKGLQK